MQTLEFRSYESVDAITTLQYGHVAPRSSDDTMMRVVNVGDAYQAEDVTLTVTGDDAAQLYLSADGDIFTASINVGDIPPQASSAAFWLRRVTPSTIADATSCTATLAATPAAWTLPVDASASDNNALDTE